MDAYGNIEDLEAWRVERRIRTVHSALVDDAIANMKTCTDNLIAAYLSKDEFRIMRESAAADSARLRLIALMGDPL